MSPGRIFLFFLSLLFSCLSHGFISLSSPRTRSLQRLEVGRHSSFLFSTSLGNAATEDVCTKLKSNLHGTCLYLVGMMGSGKSSVGNRLAEKMRYKYLDTDEIAEYMIEMPISQFFAEGGEKEFRDLENRILMEISQYTSVVVSTGGGIVINNENWGYLRHGIIVYLDVKPEALYQRLIKDKSQIAKRPLLQGNDPLQTLTNMLSDREDKYKQADVHVHVSESMSLDETALAVASEVLGFIERNPPLWKKWKAERFSGPISETNE